MSEVRLPSWSHAFSLFRAADGASHALIPLLPLLLFDMPIWSVAATAAAMNLATVPAGFLWGALMEHNKGVGRRRLAFAGFVLAGVGMIGIVLAPSFGWLLLAAAFFAAFGVATSPAASVLLIDAAPPKQWGPITARLAKRTGLAYLVGITLTTTWGLTGTLPMRGVIAGCSVLCFLAAGIAWVTIEPAAGRQQRREHSMDHVRASGRRFERAVWLPARLRLSVRGLKMATGGPLIFLLGFFLLFAGSTVFFAGYPGILNERLGYGIGLVLLAQVPSHVATPMAYGWAGRHGSSRGEFFSIKLGLAMRVLALPAIILAVLTGQFWGILIAHSVIGVSFALLQINGACIMARSHRGGRGQGMGAFHAFVALGSLVGSVVAFGVLRFLNPTWIFILPIVLLFAGAALIVFVSNSKDFPMHGATPEAAVPATEP